MDDALIVLDKYLIDDAFLAGYAEVRIVHGRGTGTLRNGVQQYLRTHPHVAKQHGWGEYGEGGIGVGGNAEVILMRREQRRYCL